MFLAGVDSGLSIDEPGGLVAAGNIQTQVNRNAVGGAAKPMVMLPLVKGLVWYLGHGTNLRMVRPYRNS